MGRSAFRKPFFQHLAAPDKWSETEIQFVTRLNKTLDEFFRLLNEPASTLTLPNLPETTERANLYVDADGVIWRAPAAEELRGSIEVSSTSIFIGGSITITCAAEGGTPPYMYAAYVYQTGTPAVALSGAGPIFAYVPSATGAYRFRYVVTDADGQQRTYESNVVNVVEDTSKLKNTIRVQPGNWTIPFANVAFDVTAVNGKPPYRHEIVVYGTGYTWYGSGSGDSATIYVSVTAGPGNYVAQLTTTDSGEEDEKQTAVTTSESFYVSQYTGG